jgi:hypothetical protein
VAVNNIARWDGTTWSPLGEGLSDSAHALTVLGGRLYVGGRFHLAGRIPVGRLACWDPATERWSAVGNAPVYDHDILALETIYDRYLVAGGYFHRFFHRGVTVVEGLWGIALFDTQAELNDDVRAGYLLLEGVSRWGAPGWVHALQVVGDDLYVGGWFNVAGIMTLGEQPSAGFPVGHLAVWHFGRPNGGWETCGDASDHVDALTSVDGDLVAAGKFVSVGPTPARQVARLDRDTGTWHPFGSGLGGGIHETGDASALAQHAATGLWVGGWFASAGGRPSANVALWTGTRGQDP